MKATDALLLKGNASDAEAIQCSPGILRRTLPGWTTQAVWAPDSGQAYVYLSPPDRLHLDTVALGAQSQACRHLYPRLAGLSVSRLEKVFDVCGAAHAQSIHAHYVVEMDPEAGWMPELSRWYDEEHMPGLAAVPGTVRARRYLNHDQGPLSLACYDLIATTVLNSPPWLVVRGTPWSDRARPHFTNTLRTMFTTVEPSQPDSEPGLQPGRHAAS